MAATQGLGPLDVPSQVASLYFLATTASVDFNTPLAYELVQAQVLSLLFFSC